MQIHDRSDVPGASFLAPLFELRGVERSRVALHLADSEDQLVLQLQHLREFLLLGPRLEVLVQSKSQSRVRLRVLRDLLWRSLVDLEEALRECELPLSEIRLREGVQRVALRVAVHQRG